MSRSPTITGLDCGWMGTQRRTLIDGGGTDALRIPIVSWLVRHPAGDVVFDAGLHPALATSTEMLGPLQKIFSVDLTPDGTVGPRLAEHQVDPAGPLTVVLSHGHFDHCGGLVELPNARVVVQRDEWQAAQTEGVYDIALLDHGHDVTEIDGEHDLFGDASIVCVPTPGHTCGHQSLRVVTDDGVMILAGDACYFSHTLDDEILPPFAHDHGAQRRSLAWLQDQRVAGATVVPGHDAAVFRTMTTG